MRLALLIAAICLGPAALAAEPLFPDPDSLPVPADTSAQRREQVAVAFVHSIESDDWGTAYSQMSPRFTADTSRKKFDRTLTSLRKSFGTPSKSEVATASVGGLFLPNGTQLSVSSIMFRTILVSKDGKEVPALLKVTLDVDAIELGPSVLTFVYIPQSNIKYMGSYPMTPATKKDPKK